MLMEAIEAWCTLFSAYTLTSAMHRQRRSASWREWRWREGIVEVE
jgi:hypothetical protein